MCSEPEKQNVTEPYESTTFAAVAGIPVDYSAMMI
jgi:hypothetical protein